MLKSIILMVLTRCVVVFQNQDTPAKWLFDICSLMVGMVPTPKSRMATCSHSLEPVWGPLCDILGGTCRGTGGVEVF